MIQELAKKYQKISAGFLLVICFDGIILPLRATAGTEGVSIVNRVSGSRNNKTTAFNMPASYSLPAGVKGKPVSATERIAGTKKQFGNLISNSSPNIGGPSQPEMSAFKSVGTDNLVNLFTGDFNYNIPLLDVGGYPVNIFYDGGIGMEQEASWVGLGWNINPGNINRNMRGTPDDFNGEDILTQTQVMKPNINWGVNLGADLELVGIKGFKAFTGSVGGTMGVSFNNYLGPALEIGIRGSTQVTIGQKTQAEKGALALGGSLSINASSRTGVTFSPSLSLTAKAFTDDRGSYLGAGLRGSTSYNSRTGIKAMQIAEQMSFNYRTLRFYEGKNGTTYHDNQSSMNAGIASTSISFNKPSYLPSMRMPLTNSAWAGHFQVGGGVFGIAVDGEVEVYKQKSEVADADRVQNKPLVGYLYLQKAQGNENAVMDFTRLNDNEVTPSTPIISAPQYTYDVFSINGEGTGGSIRAYRNDEGFVRDNLTISRDKNFSAGGDIDVPGHYGGNVSVIKTPSTIGGWRMGNKLRSATGFKSAGSGWENVYFRNPGENSVMNPNQYDRIGGNSLVRYKLGGTDMYPTIEPVLEKFSKANERIGNVDIPAVAPVTERKKRSQVTSFLNAEEASVIGLDKTIKNYDGMNVLNAQNNFNYTPLQRYDGTLRKKHHISEIDVTEANGQRYVYGIPVYNIRQKDFTFTVANTESATAPDKVDFDPLEAGTSSPNLATGAQKDGYLQITETPGYAHSFLLSGLLSPDYVDVTGDGITEDDLGTAVKFNYSKMSAVSKWRTPLTSDTKANFNAGKRTESKDDKGIVSYGERESWYLHSIESKTMVALFTLENRQDSKGSTGELSGLNSNDNSAQRLKEINLYNKADLKKNGLPGARPVKTVHFQYSYKLCANVPNNGGATETDATGANVNAAKGKLTLEKIWFTFNGQNRASKNQYVFSYGTAAADNPDYEFNASDRWGSYKPKTLNPQGQKNADYPYSLQDKNQKTTIDQNAGAWMLKKILLPSGGQLEVTYESDDYAFVQDRRAADMMQVAGFGTTPAGGYGDQLYTVNGSGIDENTYVFIHVPEACSSSQEVYQKYLSNVQQLSFKLAVNMPKGIEYVHSYATIEGNNYGIYSGDATNKTIWVKLNLVDGINPLSLTAIEFLREQLPGQAFEGYDVSESSGLAQIGDMFTGWAQGIVSAFSNPVNYLREQEKAQTVDLSRTTVRLNDPDGFKYGGGYRVKSVRLKDNWKQMNSGQLFTSEYGQDYDYTNTEVFNGTERVISSGVASYEPSFGGEENPFQTMIQVSNKVPLGPASYGAVEMPVLDAFFPAASVGYSKVTVKSIKKGVQDPSKKTRSGIGKQVTEFYTAKDFPVYYNHTNFDPSTDKQLTTSSLGLFFYKFSFDSRALSQGFVVETNDMHGKLKSKASYPENDDKTPINYTENFYRNTGAKGMDEKFDFVYASQGGTVNPGNMGIDIELMTDTREFSVKGRSVEVQGQIDCFPIFGLGPWLPFIWPVMGTSENTYRAITTTKVITYHSVLDSVLVIDKGSQVSTKNLVYDAETGDVIINRTNNAFNKPVYSTNYPAWWAYTGMGPAYKNIDAVYDNVNFLDGKIVSGNVPNLMLESGDEVYVTKQSNLPVTPPPPTPLNGTITYSCNTNSGGQGITQLNFSFSTPTAVPLRLIFGCVRSYSNIPGFLTGEGCDEFTFPSSVYCGMYPPYPAGYYVDIPANTTNFTTPFPAGISSLNPSASTPWTCPTDNTTAITDIYVKVSSPATGYITNLTLTNNNISLHNAPLPNQSCLTSSDDVTKLWVLDNNKNSGTIGITPNYYFLDKEGRVFTKNNVSFKIVRSGKRNVLQGSAGAVVSMSNPVRNNKIIIDNSSNVINATAVEYKEKWQTDNDILKKYDYVYDPVNCVVNAVANCDGIFEKNINPYTRGLLGNFRSYQSKVFYNSRKESDPAVATNIPVNGFLKDFSLYWDFSGANLYPAGAYNPKWVWNTQISKINSKGLELETKDALGIYTAAQYGFNKTMPLGIASNSRYNEMFNEGFEDKDYSETLNGAVTDACFKKHIDLYNLQNTAVVTASQYGIEAHTGKNVLRITENSTGSKEFKLSNTIADDFNVSLLPGSVGDLIDPGGNFEPLYYKDFYSPDPPVFNSNFPTEALSSVNFSTLISNPVITGFGNPSPVFSYGNLSALTSGSSNVPGNPPLATCFSYNDAAIGGATIQYINVAQTANYSFSIHQKDAAISGWMPPHQSYFYQKLIILRTSDGVIADQFEGPAYLSQTEGGYRSGTTTKSIKLCAGQYKLIFVDYQNRQFGGDCLHEYVSYYDCSQNFISNKSLLSQNVCPYTKPVPATENMLNAIFTPQAGKKMLFSAWVREGGCGTPCYKPDYTFSNVEIWSGNNNCGLDGASQPTIKRVGAIIDGWQKIEGEFTVPSGATTAEIRFINTNSAPMYVDDIRVHPYNANMKTYAYDPVNLRLVAQLDDNNYASFFEYDDEGTLIRTKAETKEGIKTITETRSAKQTGINTIQ